MKKIKLFNDSSFPFLSVPFCTSILFSMSLLAFYWGWKTSGVLENSMGWDSFVYGYRYILQTPLGDWPINRESLAYLNGMQGFLEVPGASLNIGSGYELTRMMYALLLRTFWFVEPPLACLALDIALWFGAALSFAYICHSLLEIRYAKWVGAFLTIFGQGFLQSVGEGMPHMAGYAGGFYIGTLIVYFRTWEASCPWQKDLWIYAFMGLWQLTYGTALFFFPLALLSTGHHLRQMGFPKEQVQACIGGFFLALTPFIIFSLLCKVFIKDAGELTIIIENARNSYPTFSSWLWGYGKTLIDSIISLGPFIVLGFIALAVFSYAQNHSRPWLKWLLLVGCAQFGLMAVMLTSLAGRGYATFNIVLIPLLGFVFLLERFIVYFPKRGIILGTVFLALYSFYPHSGKLGYRFPDRLFFTGFFSNYKTHWQSYDVHLFS